MNNYTDPSIIINNNPVATNLSNSSDFFALVFGVVALVVILVIALNHNGGKNNGRN